MKFRTDFVTNSSDSSFVTINFNNPELQKRLAELGIMVSGKGEFSDDNTITLPSGKQIHPAFWAGYHLRNQPYQFQSLSAWIVNSFFQSGGYDEDEDWDEDWDEDEEWDEDEDQYEDERDEIEESAEDGELKQILREHGLMTEEDSLFSALDRAFGQYDGDIVSAKYEYSYGFEGMVESADHLDLKDGVKASFSCSHEAFPNIRFRGKNVYIFDFPCKVFASIDDIANQIKEEGGTLVEELASADIAIVGEYGSDAFELARKEKNVSFAISEKSLVRILKGDIPRNWGDLENDIWSLTYHGMDMKKFNEKYGWSPVRFSTWNGKRWE